MSRYILALDQGTTSSRAILFTREGDIKQISQKEFTQIYPQPGWVEHNANEIFDTQSFVMHECLTHADVDASEPGRWRIARLRYEGGLESYTSVLTAENAVIQQRRAAADLEARALTLDAALVRALGGGFRAA